MTFGDPQFGQQEGQRFGQHGLAPVGVQGQLAGGNRLALAGLLDQPLRIVNKTAGASISEFVEYDRRP